MFQFSSYVILNDYSNKIKTQKEISLHLVDRTLHQYQTNIGSLTKYVKKYSSNIGVITLC